MKRFCLTVFIFLLFAGLATGQAFGQAQYLINGSNPLNLDVAADSCDTYTIAIDAGGVITTPLITAGVWLIWDPAQVSVGTISPYDGTLTPALWDPGFSRIVDEPAGPGTRFLTVGNFATVPIAGLRIFFC